MRVKEAQGHLKWSESELATAMAVATRAAAAAARVIGEDDTAEAWAVKAHEHEARANDLAREARALGYFPPAQQDPAGVNTLDLLRIQGESSKNVVRLREVGHG